ncbi:hypothetical protein CPB85DRAFT_1281563 [Mucidula mucida]|nr:hypothetical protein CPB85DRAFT_1281563 [Mucidula mucida]
MTSGPSAFWLSLSGKPGRGFILCCKINTSTICPTGMGSLSSLSDSVSEQDASSLTFVLARKSLSQSEGSDSVAESSSSSMAPMRRWGWGFLSLTLAFSVRCIISRWRRDSASSSSSRPSSSSSSASEALCRARSSSSATRKINSPKYCRRGLTLSGSGRVLFLGLAMDKSNSSSLSSLIRFRPFPLAVRLVFFFGLGSIYTPGLKSGSESISGKNSRQISADDSHNIRCA